MKAAAAAAPSGPAVSTPPVPDISDLVSDIAMSVAIAHVSLAASDGTPSAASVAPAAPTSKSGVSGLGKAAPQAQASGLEDVYGHLEAALQVLTRHHVAEQLQHEVAHCMQGVAVAFAEEIFRSTSPVTSHLGQGHEQQQLHEQQRNGQTAAARRARALSILRGALWRTTTSAAATAGNGGNGHGAALAAAGNGQAHGAAATAQGAGGGGGGGGVAAGATADGGAAASGQHAGSTAAAGSVDCWPPELSAEERAELMAPLRGLLTASEHVSSGAASHSHCAQVCV